MATRRGSDLAWVSQDHLAGTALVTDGGGNQVGTTMKYTPFGAARGGSVPTDRKFTGQRLDGSGLYYYGARYYDAEIGRFISADPQGVIYGNPQSRNRYSYVLNNPLRYTDPTGLWTFGVGISVNLWPGFAFSVMYVFDDKGKAGWAFTGGLMGIQAGVGGGGGITVQVTNADSIEDLRGPSEEYGGSRGRYTLEGIRGEKYAGAQVTRGYSIWLPQSLKFEAHRVPLNTEIAEVETGPLRTIARESGVQDYEVKRTPEFSSLSGTSGPIWQWDAQNNKWNFYDPNAPDWVKERSGLKELVPGQTYVVNTGSEHQQQTYIGQPIQLR